jgi:hypothetical protein
MNFDGFPEPMNFDGFPVVLVCSVFKVHAYRLALKINQEEKRLVGSSSRVDGSRRPRVYDEVWSA